MESAFFAVLIMLCLVLPLHAVVMWQFSRWESPEYFRRHGVVIRRREALEQVGTVIGAYCGAPVHDTVTFMGMAYRFHGIVPPAYRVRASELYVDPGLLYRTDAPSDGRDRVERPRHHVATR